MEGPRPGLRRRRATNVECGGLVYLDPEGPRFKDFKRHSSAFRSNVTSTRVRFSDSSIQPPSVSPLRHRPLILVLTPTCSSAPSNLAIQHKTSPGREVRRCRENAVRPIIAIRLSLHFDPVRKPITSTHATQNSASSNQNRSRNLQRPQIRLGRPQLRDGDQLRNSPELATLTPRKIVEARLIASKPTLSAREKSFASHGQQNRG